MQTKSMACKFARIQYFGFLSMGPAKTTVYAADIPDENKMYVIV